MSQLLVGVRPLEPAQGVKRCAFGLCSDEATESVAVEDARGQFAGVVLVCGRHVQFY